MSLVSGDIIVAVCLSVGLSGDWSVCFTSESSVVVLLPSLSSRELEVLISVALSFVPIQLQTQANGRVIKLKIRATNRNKTEPSTQNICPTLEHIDLVAVNTATHPVFSKFPTYFIPADRKLHTFPHKYDKNSLIQRSIVLTLSAINNTSVESTLGLKSVFDWTDVSVEVSVSVSVCLCVPLSLLLLYCRLSRLKRQQINYD